MPARRSGRHGGVGLEMKVMPKVDGHPTAAGNMINVRRVESGGYRVTTNMNVNHHCADMDAVIELLHLRQPGGSADGKANGTEP